MSRRTPAEPEIAGTPITGVEALQVDAGGTPKPMALTDYKLGHLPDTDTVRGYIPLGTNIDGTLFLPNASEHLVANSPGAPLALSLGGVVAQIEIPTGASGGALHQPSEVVSIVDSDWGPGRVWAQGEELRSHHAGQVDPFGQFDGIFAIFTRVGRPNPLYSNPNIQGDWELATVLTTGDAFPKDRFVDDRFAGGQQQAFINSMLGVPEARFIERNGGSRKVNALLDHAIDFGGKLVEALENCPQAPGVELEKVMAEALKKTPTEARDFIKNYMLLNENDPLALRVFARAHAIMEDAEKEAEGKKEGKKYIDRIRRHERKELLQAYLHAYTVAGVERALKVQAVASNTPYISPFPFSADLYDRFDFEFINLLGKINAGDFQDKIESLESRGFRRNPEDIPYHGLLNIISTQKNHPLFVADSFHGSGSEQKGALLYDGRCLPVDSPGSTALEMGRSLYRRGDSLLVDGVIGRWGTGTANRGQLQHSSEHMVLDLGKTPGRILRHIVEIGMLTGDRQDVPSGMGMLLSEMLSTKPGPRELIAVHETLGGMVAKGVISESTGIHWVQRGGGSNSSKALSVAAEPTVPVKASRVEKISGGALARLRKAIELSGRVAVVGTTGLTKDGGKPIAGAFLHDGIPYVMQAMNTGATVTVMPNEHVARAGRSRRGY